MRLSAITLLFSAITLASADYANPSCRPGANVRDTAHYDPSHNARCSPDHATAPRPAARGDSRPALIDSLRGILRRGNSPTVPSGISPLSPLSPRSAAVLRDATPITEGQTVEGSAAAGKYAFFSAGNLTGTGPVLISVTAMTGDPDLFVSLTDAEPRSSSGDLIASSQDLGGEEVSIDNASAGPYYIGILAFGWSPSRFTVSVTRQKFLSLESGQPSTGVVSAGVDRFYRVDFPRAADHVTVVVTAETFWGMRLYVNGIRPADGSDPFYTPGSSTGAGYQWHSSYDLPRRVIANSGDSGYCGGVPEAEGTCSLYVTVHGSSYMRNVTAFTITAATSESTVHLQPGVTTYDVVPDQDEDYFDVYIDREDDVSISLTALSGNPNLFVSTTSETPGPNDYTWRSSFYGTDSIEIPTTDPNYCTNCLYHIGVGGTANAYFTITAGYASNYTALIPGVPITGATEPGETRHYRLYAEGSHPQSIEFTVSSVHGATPALRISTLAFPERINAQWQDIGWTGNAREVVRPTDDNACINCYYYISVSEYHDAKGMNFTLLAAPSTETIVLQDGVPQAGQVARHEYAYFSIELNLVQDLTINLSPTSGDPDLFISTTSRRPKRGNSTWASRNYFGDEVTIATTDPDFCSNCRYFIGVYGYSASSFTIVASHVDTAVELTPGEVYSVSSAAGQNRSYEVEVGAVQDHITFTVSPTSGWPHVYISTSRVPSSQDHMWSVAGYPAVKRIDPTDPNFCHDCTYYVSVVSRFSDTDYTIQVAIADEGVTLQTGVPTYGEIQGSGEVYFRVFISGDKDVVIDVTPYSGDPDLYVSKSERHPSPSSYDWSGISFGGDRVLIRKTDDKWCNDCYYYIGVRSYQTERLRFTITASESDGTLLLHEGVPLEDSIGAGEVRKVLLTLQSPTPRVTVSVSPSRGVPDLYLSTTGFPVPGNATTYSWWATHGNPVVLTAAEGDNGWCQEFPCSFYFVVSPRADSGGGLAYTIQASGSERTVTLIAGRAQIDSAPPRKYRYYRFYPVNDDDIRISVSAIEGDPDVYVSVTNPTPTVGNKTWSAARLGDDTITISRGDTNRCQGATANACVYYVGVRNFNSRRSAQYTITVTQAQVITEILTGVPYDDVVPAGGAIQEYRLHVSRMVQDHVAISLTPRRGVPDLFVSTASTKINPSNSSTYQWRATHGVPVGISAHPGDPGFCTGCDYIIGVRAHANSTGPVWFSLSASASNDSVTLRAGEPIMGTVSPFSYSYYQVGFETQGTVVISVTALSGRNEDPDIFVACASDGYRPTSARHRWAGQFFGADTVTIASNDPNYCSDEDDKFVIGVTDIMDFSSGGEVVSFLVSAHLEESGFVELQAGLPQSGIAAANSAQRFAFHVDPDSESSSTPISRVTFTMTPKVLSAGQHVMLYAAASADSATEGSVPSFPVPSNTSTFFASGDGDPTAQITVKRGDPGFCTGCTYGLLVDADANVEFTITAQTSAEAVVLQTGTPFQALVHSGETITFVYSVLRLTGDVTFSATPFAGDAGMIVGLADHADDGEWLVPSIAEAGTLTIPEQEIAAITGSGPWTFVIRVRGNEASGNVSSVAVPFTITATLADDTITLTPGDPLEVSFAGSRSRNFRLLVPPGDAEPLAISAVSPVDVGIDANPNDDTSAPRYPTDDSPGVWSTEAMGTPSFLSINTEQLGQATTVFIRIRTNRNSGNSTLLVTAAFESSLVQLRDGIPGFVAVEGKGSGKVGRFKASFADGGGKDAADKVVFAQGYSGAADLFLSVNENPDRDHTTNSWSMTVAAGENNEPGPLEDVTIVADQEPCASGGCGNVYISAFPTTTDTVTLSVTAATKGSAIRAAVSVTYVIKFKNGEDWNIFRYVPFYENREVTLSVDISGEGAELVYSLAHAVPPASIDPLPAGYTAISASAAPKVSIPAGSPFYVFIGSTGQGADGDTTSVVWNLDAPEAPPASPAPSGSPGTNSGSDKDGLSSKTVAILIVSSVFGLIFLVGCCVFVSRFENIRRLYRGRAGQHYSEVMH